MSLPRLYQTWIDEVLGGPLPEERHASCSTCAMCEPHAARAATASSTRFDPATKCCTYTPGLPNFLVGLILDDDEPGAAKGRDSVRRRIGEDHGVTPLGLQTPIQSAVVYKYAGGELFGRHGALRCPHYLPEDGGKCGIWRHRNGVCATWFCKHEHGAAGQALWRALAELLGTVERQLALWCAGELGQGVETLGPSLLPYYQLMTRLPPSGRAAHTWTEEWRGRIEDFYVAAGRLVRPLCWPQVREICGPTLGLEVKALRGAMAALHQMDPPQRLRYNATAVLPTGRGEIAVAGYSERDMVRLAAGLVDELGRFDGRRSGDEVAEAIAQATGITLDVPAIRRLLQFRVLAPVHHAVPAAQSPGAPERLETTHGR
jgi:hypothetical protein